MEQAEIFKIAQIDGCCPYCLEARHPTTADQAIDLASSLPEGKFSIKYHEDYLMVCPRHQNTHPEVPQKVKKSKRSTKK